MNPEEKKDLEIIQDRFSNIKKDDQFTNQQQIDKFTTDISRLMGIYNIDQNKTILKLIKEMISFADKNNVAVDGFRIELKDLLD